MVDFLSEIWTTICPDFEHRDFSHLLYLLFWSVQQSGYGSKLRGLNQPGLKFQQANQIWIKFLIQDCSRKFTRRDRSIKIRFVLIKNIKNVWKNWKYMYFYFTRNCSNFGLLNQNFWLILKIVIDFDHFLIDFDIFNQK